MTRKFRFCLLPLTLAGAICGAHGASPTPKDEGPGRTLYLNKCSKCHKLYDPARYSDTQWQGWMEKMSRKAKLTPKQEKLLEDYIEQQLRGNRRQKAPAEH